MPLYEYVCQDCGIRFDALRSIKDADRPIMCQNCQSQNSLRQLSLFYAQSGGKAVAGTNGGCSCGNCSAGSCASCSH